MSRPTPVETATMTMAGLSHAELWNRLVTG